MEHWSPPARRSRLIVLGFFYILFFIALDRFAIGFAATPKIVPWYPGIGLNLALLLALGIRFAPIIFLGTFSALAIDLCCQSSPLAWTMMALILTLGYGGTAIALRHILGAKPDWRDTRAVLKFVGVGLIAPAIIGVPIIVNLMAFDFIVDSDFAIAWLNVWIGDVIGIVTVTPFLLTHVTPGLQTYAQGARWRDALALFRARWRRAFNSRATVLEIAAQTFSIVLVLWIAFVSPLGRQFQLFYLYFLPLIWIALRFGLSGATTGNLVLNVGALVSFHNFQFDLISLADLQIFMFVLSLTGVLLGAAVSEQRHTQRALRRNEELYRTLARNFPNGAVILFDHQLRYTIADGAGLAEVGLPKEYLEGKTIWEAFPRETCEILEPYYRAALAGTVSTFEISYAARIYQVHTLPIRDPNNNIVAGMVMTQEVTTAKLAEQALRHSQEKYAALVNSIDSIVWEGDARTFHFNFVSQQAERLLGYPATRWTTEPSFWRDHIHPDDREWAINLCARATAEKRAHEFEYRMIASDGRIVWLRDLVTVVVENDQPVILRGVMIDITKQKQAEAALAERMRVSALGEEIGMVLTQSTMLHQTLQGCAEAIVRHLDAALAHIWMINETGAVLYLQAAAGLDTRLDGAFSQIPVGKFKIGEIAHVRQPYFTNDIENDSSIDHAEWMRESGLQSFAGYPLLVEDQLVGVLAVWARQPLSEVVLEALASNAGGIAISIKRALAEQALLEREQQYRSIFEATSDALIINDPVTGIVIEANPAAYKMHGYTRDEFIGLHPAAFIHSDSHHMFGKFMATVTAGETFEAQAMDVRKDGSAFHVEVHGNQFTLKGQPHLLGVVRDITERVEAYQLLEQRVYERTREIERRRAVAEGLRDILNILNSNRSLPETLQQIVAQACRLLGTNAATIMRLDSEHQLLRMQAAQGFPPEHIAQLTIPIGLGASGRAVDQRKPVLIGDLERIVWQDGLMQDPHRRALVNFLLSRYRTLFAVPLLIKDEVYGAVTLYYPETPHLSEEEIQLAITFADQAALAIENARLYEQARQLAALEERQNLARELHDSVSQALYGIALGARTARTQLEREPHRAVEPLDYVLSLADAGLAEMRALIFELRPESLEQEGLVAALSKQADSLRARHNLQVHTNLGAEPVVPLQVKYALYRIAQEALQNTIKHARASQVEIRLENDYAHVVLEIGDNGSGFDTTQVFPGHLGLHSMRERANQVGGTLDVASVIAQGTRIRVAIPNPVEQ